MDKLILSYDPIDAIKEFLSSPLIFSDDRIVSSCGYEADIEKELKQALALTRRPEKIKDRR